MNEREKRAFVLYGEICELFFGMGYSMIEIGKSLKTNPTTVSEALSRYFKKPPRSIVLQSKINPKTPRKLVHTRIILDSFTGIYYINANELAQAINRPHRTVCGWLNGERKQKDNRFIIV